MGSIILWDIEGPEEVASGDVKCSSEFAEGRGRGPLPCYDLVEEMWVRAVATVILGDSDDASGTQHRRSIKSVSTGAGRANSLDSLARSNSFWMPYDIRLALLHRGA